MPDNDVLTPSGDIGLLTREDSKVKKPSMYRVVLHNDEITHGEFVIRVLNIVFNKSLQEALVITRKAHMSGAATVSILPKSIADAKVKTAMDMAKENEFPLLFTSEKEDDEED